MAEMNPRPEVVLLTNVAMPYRVRLFELIARELSETHRCRLTVVFYSDPRSHASRRGKLELPRDCDFAWEQITDPWVRLGNERVLTIPVSILRRVRRPGVRAVVVGNMGLLALAFSLTRPTLGAPLIVWSGAVPRGVEGRGFVRLLRRLALSRFSAGIAYGTAAADYLTSLGMPDESVFVAVNSVDVSALVAEVDLAKSNAESRTADDVRILCVGGLTDGKGTDLLVDALATARAAGASASLVVAGDGPERSKLEAQVLTQGLDGHVRLLGRVPPADMPAVYAAADLLVFPSLYDCWGLVLNEAMAAGLPVIASPLAGATRDLVGEGVEGLVVDPRGGSALADAIVRLAGDREGRARMGRAARKRILEDATLEGAAGSFVRAVEYAWQAGGTR
jgi:glycosyltransferase involved in cell wall biosynthesis